MMALVTLAVLERAGNGDNGGGHGAHDTFDLFVDVRLLPLVQSQLRSSTAARAPASVAQLNAD